MKNNHFLNRVWILGWNLKTKTQTHFLPPHGRAKEKGTKASTPPHPISIDRPLLLWLDAISHPLSPIHWQFREGNRRWTLFFVPWNSGDKKRENPLLALPPSLTWDLGSDRCHHLHRWSLVDPSQSFLPMIGRRKLLVYQDLMVLFFNVKFGH